MPKRLHIDQALFLEAFGRSVDKEPYPSSTYLDLQSGEMLWIYDNDADAGLEAGTRHENARNRIRVTSTPARYLLVPGMTSTARRLSEAATGRLIELAEAFLRSKGIEVEWG